MKILPALLLGALLSASPQTNLYQLLVDSQGLVGIVSFNGVPMLRLDGNPRTQAALINPWIHAGENSVAFEYALDRSSNALAVARLKLRLAVAWRGEKGVRNEPLWAYELPRKKNGAPDIPPEETLTGETRVELPLHTKTWLDVAPKITIDEGVRKRLAGEVAAFHRAVETSDQKALERLTWWKTEETARLGGLSLTPAQFTVRVSNFIGVLKGFRLEKLDTKGLRFDPLAGDRVVVVTREGNRSPIAFTGPKGDMEIDLYYGMVSNRWMLVR
ncbi:MAG: hypothetical protein J0L75_15560 [Spirochaetes bacterium]|nr:hypothetical protein [Spirochaetota bacterium]